jgi:asparagine synthase (glutamine-hydrolysing)
LCGIAGFTHINQRVDPARIRRATASIVHRGPDEIDVFENECVSLGAVRLKIIDLEHGHQPMRDEDGDAVLVFNGEIYNHAELRAELQWLGHRFESRCDTEVVLRAFQEWNTDSFAKLRGMFALAIWINSERRLVLARDRMGIKPLYFHHRGQNFYFGSELKTILEHPEVERRICHEGLHHFLSLNYVPCPYTLIEGIEKLPPGHWLEWRNGAVRSEAYWQLRFAPDDSMTLDAAKDELDFLMRQSVREHLVSDVPLGVWASGGLDSSAIVHYASEISPSPLKTFSIAFSGRAFDESRYFRQISELYGTDHHELDLSPDESIIDVIEQMAFYSDEPSADAGAVPVWFLSEMTRKHVTVALSGEGADELFGGYVTYLADDYARSFRRVPEGARRAAAKLAQLIPVSDNKISFEYKLNRFLKGSLLAPSEAHVFWNGTFNEAEKRRLHLHNGHESTRNFLDRTATDSSHGELNRWLALDQRCYLPDDILYKCDRMSMAHSLEVRPPFLDHRIVEFAARLPEHMKVRGRNLKFILRQLMQDKLPAPILTRKKEGFDIPAHQWLRSLLKPLLVETLNQRAVEESGLFHWGEIEAIMDAHLNRRANLGYHLWGLLVLFLWMKRWKVQPAASGKIARELFSTASATN